MNHNVMNANVHILLVLEDSLKALLIIEMINKADNLRWGMAGIEPEPTQSKS